MPENIHQHFITEAYIKAWRDPSTPQSAYVWIVSKLFHDISRKSPRTLFTVDDIYTVINPDGTRDISLERYLKDIEDCFLKLRIEKLINKKQLTKEDRNAIALFVSTMFTRTNTQKEDGKKIWQEYLDFIDGLPPEKKAYLEATKAHNDVINIHSKQPLPFHIRSFAGISVPIIVNFRFCIYETRSSPGFITSDNPCIWFDPLLFNPNIPLSFFGLDSPELFIGIPISPNLFLSIQPFGPDGYIDLDKSADNPMEMIDALNGMTFNNCDYSIVVNQSIFKQEWVQQ